MSYSEQVRKDAKAAADYIREHGWCQGTSYGPNGTVCAWGAMCQVGFVGANAVRDAFRLEVGVDAPDFNDFPMRTKEEVLAVFDRIANSTTP